MSRFDVIYKSGGTSMAYHFCRAADCFGTDDTHGYSFDEAKEVVVRHLETTLETWRAMSFEDWRRNNHPTKEEMDEDMDLAYEDMAREMEDAEAKALK